MADEIWRALPGASDYEVSSQGRTRRRSNGRILKASVNPRHGYLHVKILWDDGVRRASRVNVVVALAFLGPNSDRLQVAHADGNRTNNDVGNLRYATPVENAADKLLHGTHNRGERHNCVKLTRDQVREIRRLAAHGDKQVHIAEAFGVSPGAIRDIVAGRVWAWLDEYPRRASGLPNRLKTHCSKGHPYDEANTYWISGGRRDCRICIKDRTERRRLRSLQVTSGVTV